MKKITKRFLGVCALIASSMNLSAQSAANYVYTTNTGNALNNMTGATQTAIVNGSANLSSALSNIGFDLWYMGVRYTQFSVNSNGVLELGSTVVTGTQTTMGLASQPLIVSFADFLWSNSTGVQYLLSGVAPNRKMTIQWTGMGINGNSFSVDGTFQIVLNENTGKIEFNYGNPFYCGYPSASGQGAQIGFSTGTTSNTMIRSVTLNNLPTAGGVLVTNIYTTPTSPATQTPITGLQSGRKIIFAPLTNNTAPSALTFTCITKTSMTLNWTNDGTNFYRAAIYMSTNPAGPFNYVSDVPSNTFTYNASGLTANTTYYWKVYAINEGNMGTPVTGTQATQNIVASASSTNICNNNTTTLSLAAGYIGGIQWQSSPNNSTWTNIPGATTTPYTTTPLTAATYFRAVITNTCSDNSNSVYVIVSPLGGTTTASPNPVCIGTTTTLTLNNSAGTLQWQSSLDNITWTNIPGATMTPYTTAAINSATYYRAKLSNGTCPDEFSNVIQVNVYTYPATPGPITGPTKPCIGSTVTYSVSPVSGATTYNWTVPTGSAITAGTGTNIITVLVGAQNGLVLVSAGNACGTGTANSLNFDPQSSAPPATGAISGPTSVCANSSATYSVSSVSTASYYLWTVPAGASISSGQGTISINVLFGSTSGNVAVKDSNGCGPGPVVTKAVTVNPLPIVNVTPAAPVICAGGSSSLTASGANTYAWSPSSTLSSSTGANVTATPTSTTTYTVTGTSAAGCTNTHTVVVTVNPLPTITINPSSSTICNGGNTNLSASGANTYAWSPSGSLSSSTGANVTAAPTTTTTYTVTGTSAAGCANTTTVTVSVNPLPTLTISPASATICGGSSTNLSVSGANTYVWNPSSTLSSSTGSSVTASPTATTTYTVTGTSATGCTSTANVTVTVNPLPNVTITPSAATICNGNSTSLSANGANTYLWTPSSSLSSSTGSSVIANPTTTTTYTIVGTSAAGCTNTASVTVTVDPLPTVTITPSSATICNGGSTSLSVSGANTYVWTPSGSLNSSTGLSVTATPTITTTYTVTGTSSTGCTNTASVTVTVNPIPTISVSPSSATICNGSSVSLTANGGNTYSWNTSATTNSITVSPSTTTTYTVTGISSAGCSNTANVTVTVNPIPTISVSPSSATICNGNSVSLTANGGNTYSWNTSTTTNTINVSPTVTTTYTVTGTSSTGCTNTASVTVTVNPIPTISVSPSSATICNGSSVSLTANGGNTYSWNTSATTNSITVSPSTTTTYTVTGISSAGCSNTANVTVTVNPVPTISVSPSSATICNGNSVSLTANGGNSYSWNTSTTTNTISVSPTTTTTYTVTGSSGAGCTNTANVTVTVNPAPITPTITANNSTIFCQGDSIQLTSSSPTNNLWSTNSSNQSVYVNASGNYFVTVTDNNGCSATSATTTVTVNPLPVVSFTGLSSGYCLNDPSSTLAGSPSGGTFTGPGVSGNSFSPSAAGAGNFSIVYSYTDGNGCSNSSTQTTTVSNNAVVNLGPNINLCTTSQTTLNAGNFSTYSWSDGSTASTLVVDGTVVGPGSHTYYVNVTNGNNCTGSDTVVVDVSVCTGIKELANNMDVNVFPNPTNGTFNISIGNALGNKLKLEIMSIEGQLVLSKESIKTTGELIDISDLAKGVYFLRVCDDTQVSIKKIVLQ